MYYKKNTRVPFGKIKMHIYEWCEEYDLPWDLLQKRISGGWQLANALIMPACTGMAYPWQARRAIVLKSYGWSDAEIAKRLGLKPEEVLGVNELPEMISEELKAMNNAFWIDTENKNKDYFALIGKGNGK